MSRAAWLVLLLPSLAMAAPAEHSAGPSFPFASAFTAEILEDADHDGRFGGDERRLRTDPLDADTDSDGLADGAELQQHTDPLGPDTDGDGLSDGAEAAAGADPHAPDTDGDGLTDGEEV